MITTQEHPVVIEQLDLVEEGDQITHFITIEEEYDPEDYLSKKYFLCIIKNYTLLSSDVFKFDPEYLASEDKYKQIRNGKALYIIPSNVIWCCYF